MRIAVCLSGQPRFLKECLPNLKRNLIDSNSADVFIHTWWDPKDVGNFFDTSIPDQKNSVGIIETGVPEKLNSIFPTRIEIDLPRKFEIASQLRSSDTAKPNSLCSNFYSQYRVIALKSEYEKLHGFTYDAVIRARLDLYCEKEIKISEITHDLNEYLVLASIWQDIRQQHVLGLGDYTMDDNMVVSSSMNLNKYAETFSRMKEINEMIYPPYAENYLGYNCKILNNMKVETYDFPIDIAQRILNKQRFVK
jgi:hypothetical protein